MSTTQGKKVGEPIRATAASAFIDSIGVDTHWTFPSYRGTAGRKLQQLLIDSGIRHIRDNADPETLAVLSRHGIRETLIIDPVHGLIPNGSYWSGAAPQDTHTIADYLHRILPQGSVDAVEMPNELDVFYKLYKWRPHDESSLSDHPTDPRFYGNYGEQVTKDCWREIKSDPSLAQIKIIGPTVGVRVPSPFATGSLYDYVDWGGFHPYPGRANTWTEPKPYDTIQKYYWNSSEPSVNIGEDRYGGNPLMFQWYQPPFEGSTSAKPMAATETGYQTAPEGKESISVEVQAKYVPRLFAEYFRNGIARTFLYELFDEANDPADKEKNFGIVYNNLTPKPACTALRSLIELLGDKGVDFKPGSLTYSVAAQSNGAYTRVGYVHDLLLQKSDGDFYLLIWHEISDSSNSEEDGKAIEGRQRDIYPPALTTTLTLPASIKSASVYRYDSAWCLSPRQVSIQKDELTLPVTDTITVVQLHPQ